MKYAIKHSDKLKTLILVNTISASSTLAHEANKQLAEKFSQEEIEQRMAIIQSAAFRKGDPAKLDTLFKLTLRPSFYNRSLIDSLRLNLPTDYQQKNTKLRFLTKEVANYDIHSDLTKITCSTLLIHGDTDPTPIESVEKIQAAIPGSELIIFENCGHFPFIESRQRFLKTISDYVQNH